MKRSLQKSIGQKLLTLEQLITILAEVEGIVNTRPLTYVYDEFDSGFILTPAHFLMSYFLSLMMASTDIDEMIITIILLRILLLLYLRCGRKASNN